MNKNKIILIVVLINALSFGLGFLLGARIFLPNPIIIQKCDGGIIKNY